MISFGVAGTGTAAGRPAPQPRRRALAAMLSLAILVVSPGCGDKNTFVPPPPPKVTVSQPVTQPVTDYLEFTGNTQAINTVQLKARVEGYLEKVFFKDGDRVQKGQLLFLIQQNTYEAKLKQAEAEILSQKAKLFHAKTEYARFTKLVAQKAAAQTDVDNWLYQRDAAQAAVMSAEAQRDLARLNLSYTKVTSPFVGRIGRRLKDPGNLVGAGEATLLADVDQIDPLYVYFTMNERDLLDVTKETKESVGAVIRKDIPLYLGSRQRGGLSPPGLPGLRQHQPQRHHRHLDPAGGLSQSQGHDAAGAVRQAARPGDPRQVRPAGSHRGHRLRPVGPLPVGGGRQKRRPAPGRQTRHRGQGPDRHHRGPEGAGVGHHQRAPHGHPG